MIEVERDGEIQLIRFADRVNLLSIETLNELKRAVFKQTQMRVFQRLWYQ